MARLFGKTICAQREAPPAVRSLANEPPRKNPVSVFIDTSIVDRTSFAVMERLGLTEAASFDYDFAIYRYGRNRDRAFRILK